MIRVSIENIQSISNILSQIILNGINFLLIILFTHYLNPRDYGVVSLYISYTLFLSVILGLSTHGSIGTAFIYHDRNKYNFYLSSIYFLSCLSFVAFLILSIILKKYIQDLTGFDGILLLMLFFHSFGIFSYEFISTNNIFQKKAQNNLLIVSVLVLGMLLMCILAINFGEYFSEKYIFRILSLAVPYIFCAIYVILRVFWGHSPIITFRESIRFCLPICIPLVIHGISHIILSQTDRIMIQKILDDYYQVGIYSFIVTFSHVLNTIGVALNNTWVPIFYNYLKHKDYDSIIFRSNNYLRLMTLVVLGFLMVVPEFVYLLAENKYWDGLSIIPIVTLSNYFIFLYFIPVNFELYHKESRIVAIGTFAASIGNIALNFLLIPIWGIKGAAMATAIAYFLLLFFHIKFACFIGKGHFPYNIGFFSKYICMVIMGCLFFCILINHYKIRWIIAMMILLVIMRDFLKRKTVF